ncbi:MAG: hypothetical protein ACXWP1_12400, partial [Bdellovibrionota bacterium]
MTLTVRLLLGAALLAGDPPAGDLPLVPPLPQPKDPGQETRPWKGPMLPCTDELLPNPDGPPDGGSLLKGPPEDGPGGEMGARAPP